MIYADFESILGPEINAKQDPDEFYTDKYQNHVGFIFGYELACVDDQFSKLFKSYLGRDGVHKFITIDKLKKMMKILKALQNVEFVIILLLKIMLN